MKNSSIIGVVAIAAMLSLATTSATQAADPAIKCESGKLKEAGKYASCRMKAESKAVKKGELPDYTKCTTKFFDKWSKTETKADGACPTTGDDTAVEAAITTCMSDVAGSLTTCGAVGGVGVGGACWFLGADQADCDATCAGAGLSYDFATRTYAGSDGTNANCEAVLDALDAGHMGALIEEAGCSEGWGCVKFFANAMRCGPTPETTSSAAEIEIRRACACQ